MVLQILDILLDAGADPCQADKQGIVPLMEVWFCKAHGVQTAADVQRNPGC